MPSFPHTLIGLGPFANLSCQIVFTKPSVSVIHPDGHSILEGWREQHAPHLWCLPLQTNLPNVLATALLDQHEEPGPRGSTANFLISSPIPTIQSPPPSLNPTPDRPPATTSTNQLHPSQGFGAVNNVGHTCFISYKCGVAEALALAAQASKTSFDVRSLDLPSVGALVGFYHACLGFPIKQTWLEAIKADNCESFDGLTYSNAARYCPDADETIMGHLAQQCQNVHSTKARPSVPNQSPLLSAKAPQASTLPSNEVYIRVYPISKLYMDNTGRFPIKACSGNQYVMIAYHVDGNLISRKPSKAGATHTALLHTMSS